MNDVNKLEMEFLASIVSVITIQIFSYKGIHTVHVRIDMYHLCEC